MLVSRNISNCKASRVANVQADEFDVAIEGDKPAERCTAAMADGTSGVTPANRRACAATRGASLAAIHRRGVMVPVVALPI